MSGNILDTIDGALTDYALSDDAMRWTPEPEEMETADQLAGVTADEVMAAFGAFARLTQEFAVSFTKAMTRWAKQVATWTAAWRILPPAETPLKVRTHAADRTNSTRHSAGSRRTKRHARNRRKGDT